MNNEQQHIDTHPRLSAAGPTGQAVWLYPSGDNQRVVSVKELEQQTLKDRVAVLEAQVKELLSRAGIRA